MVSRFCWLSGHLESQSFQKKSRAVSGVGLEGELEQGDHPFIAHQVLLYDACIFNESPHPPKKVPTF